MFGTLIDWRAWATARGDNAPSAATDPVATAALVRASDHVQFAYGPWMQPGFDMARDEVKFAAYHAALLELAKPGFFARTYTDGETKVLTEVKGIKWSIVDGPGASSGIMAFTPVSTTVDNLLRPYMQRNVGYSIKAVG
jgi:hypothetical protein